MSDIRNQTRLINELEQLRGEMSKALDAANGNQQDPRVQALADRFDALLNEYMKQQKEGHKEGAP